MNQSSSSIYCGLCGRHLTDPQSIKQGCGPICAEKALSFLSACGTSDAEIDILRSIDDQYINRQIRLFYGAMFAGRRKDATHFMMMARRRNDEREREVAILMKPKGAPKIEGWDV